MIESIRNPIAPLTAAAFAAIVAASTGAAPQDSPDPASVTTAETPLAESDGVALPPGIPIRRLVRTATPPEIDGVLDDAAWRDALVIDDFRQTDPVEGGEPSERTRVLLLFDEHFLYVAFRCYDREPDKIIATQMRRDADLSSDDRVSFTVDPFFNRRNGYFFEMNAVGAKSDALISNNRQLRREWDGIWYGKSSIDADGWVIETAIPFKTLSFNPHTTRWSFNASRFIRRRNESLRWATPTRNSSLISIADAGVLEGIEDITQGTGLDINPYVLGRAKRDHDRDRDGFDFDGGVDFFYKLTPATTLSLTVNTDFAETEVDERRVNLTRFPLFFPEKRDFFLQDEGIFSFGGIRRNPLPFQSRRIGLNADGETVPILAGVKLTGYEDALNLGILDVQMHHDAELGNKNLFVGRAAFNVLEQSTIGGIFTYGDPSTPRDNWLAGMDFNYRDSTYNGDRVIEGNAWGQYSESTGDGGTGSAYGIKAEYPNDRIDWRLGFTHIDDDFNAALGFVPRRGIREYFGNWRYRWRPESSWIRRIDSGIGTFLVTDLDNEVESHNVRYEIIEIENQIGDEFAAEYSWDREVLTEDFEISDGVVLPPGDYRYDRYEVSFESTRGRPWNVDLRYSGGEFFSGTRDEYGVEFDWRPSRHLDLGVEYELNDIDLDEGDFITRVIRGRVNIYFTPSLTWSSFIQYDSDSDLLGVNSRVRWIIEPGSEVFFVFNQTVERDGSSYQAQDTEFVSKATVTFRF